MEPDLPLVSRYDVPAPRYTSYPTAAQFHPGVGARDYACAVRATNADPVPAPLALYLHLPFCRSLCYYCGCTKIVTGHPEKVRHYHDVLAAEAALIAPLLASDRKVSSLHLGGGTPTYLPVEEIAGLIAHLGEHFSYASAPGREWAIEVDPRTIEPKSMEKLRAIGFNRVSLGVQDFDPEVQAAINRIQPAEKVHELIDAARDAGIEGVNLDLIYGLPRQADPGFERTLEEVVRLKPDRIALYGYAHLPDHFPAQRLIPETVLPRGAAKLRLLASAIGRLSAAGYVYIGMDHFARPHDPLARARARGTLVRNFQGYVPGPSTDLIGLGMSAISSLGGVYAQNAKSVPVWEEAVAAGHLPTERGYVLSEEDMLRRDVIQAIMCQDEVAYEPFENRYAIDFKEHFAPALGQLDQAERDELVERGPSSLRITSTGRLFLRAIAKSFDAYLPGKPADSAGPVTYSRAV